MSFKDLGLLSWVTNNLEDLGIKSPTEVQKECIPQILGHKRDVLACAETGSGKTAAFTLPILNDLSRDPYGIFAVILSPTQELCHQIAETVSLLGKPINVKVVEVLGGQDMVEQASLLSKKPHIVIATPGRLADHLRLSTSRLRLSQVKYLVLDEADRLLDSIDSDFQEDLETLFNALPKAADRRTLMFSATLTDTLKEINSLSKNKPFLYDQKREDKIAVGENENLEINLPKTLSLSYIPIQESLKDVQLLQYLDIYRENNPKNLVMIFTKTCRNCQILAMVLTASGHHSVMLREKM